MKIGIISDIHSNIYGLKAVLAELKDVDKIICAGDVIGYYTFVNEVMEELGKYSILYIKGNHEHFLFEKEVQRPIIAQAIDYTRKTLRPEYINKLEKAPEEFNQEIGGLKIKMYHGSPWSVDEYMPEDSPDLAKLGELGADVIILGHTHIPMVKTIGDTLIINPGSCGQPRDYNEASGAILDTETSQVKIIRVKYDYNPVIQAIIKNNFDPKLIDILKRTK